MEKTTIKGVPVIEIYESFDGSYWFVTEKAWTQDSVISGKVYENDQILFGYVRLSGCPDCAEWGYFSESELLSLGPRVWKVHRQDWAVCPEVEVEEGPDGQGKPHVDGCGGVVPQRSCSYSNHCKEVDEKMETETQRKLDDYVALYDAVSERLDNDAVAIAILQELSKDRRSGEIRVERAAKNGEANANEPATEKQKKFMKKLNIAFPANVTKYEASKLLDEELARLGE
jgi:hypothetical protein